MFVHLWELEELYFIYWMLFLQTVAQAELLEFMNHKDEHLVIYT